MISSIVWRYDDNQRAAAATDDDIKKTFYLTNFSEFVDFSTMMRCLRAMNDVKESENIDEWYGNNDFVFYFI